MGVIRQEGFYDGVDVVLMDKLIERGLTTKRSEEFSEALIDYVCTEGEGISKGHRLIGTTEVLEGLSGRYKYMAGENKMSLNGLGRLILCMGSRVGEFSERLVSPSHDKRECKDVHVVESSIREDR
jgi:hypothetical protein